jgi:hypothetical protein
MFYFIDNQNTDQLFLLNKFVFVMVNHYVYVGLYIEILYTI